ncbi:phosphotransferase family protein [Glycomyces terrestris]|uniref:Aminoglycoside phosphotransferase family protein n=1 Tax=Glycomyces terrestris TaxID=2493553 RepID=A0A426UV84_9ACTN|nr:aminoglycoside phosphotransferase family protein [Glycomyces terrestris]RRR98234.1 aminoglycoside phosphotransferase family protein [Glycomyces terrestris]
MKTTLSEEQAAQAMRGLLGPVDDWTRLAEGEVSQAFAFRADGRDLVLRIAPRREGFDKDAWAAAKLAGTGVPVPEVLHVGPVAEGAYCCVSERLGGVHLTGSDAAHQRRCAPAVRAVIEAIAAVDLQGTRGYGSVDPATGNGTQEDWTGQLRALLPADWDYLEDRADREMAEELTATALDIAASLPVERRLVHGDLNPGNFTVEGDRIAGVFDWETVMIGDPMWELARYVLWAPVMPGTRIQADHDLDRLAGAGVEQRLRALVIVNGLWALDIYRGMANAPAVQLVLNRLPFFRDEPLPVDTGREDYWMRLGRRR